MRHLRTSAAVLAALVVPLTGCTDTPTGPSTLQVVRDTLFAIGDVAELEVEVTGASGPVRWTSLDPGILSVST